MKTGTDGIIDLLMEQDSIFTGKTDAGDGNILWDLLTVSGM